MSNTISQFKYFNFKLAVIEVLMYEAAVLVPQFSVHDFVAGYSGRRIDVEAEGYGIIPEVQQYFEELVISADLLSQVEEISQDGGDIIYHQLFPFWDGEDDRFNITSTEDLTLLPNLRKITLFYDEYEELAARFIAQGIEADYL
jgi:hypothetical protein